MTEHLRFPTLCNKNVRFTFVQVYVSSAVLNKGEKFRLSMQWIRLCNEMNRAAFLFLEFTYIKNTLFYLKYSTFGSFYINSI